MGVTVLVDAVVEGVVWFAIVVVVINGVLSVVVVSTVLVVVLSAVVVGKLGVAGFNCVVVINWPVLVRLSWVVSVSLPELEYSWLIAFNPFLIEENGERK